MNFTNIGYVMVDLDKVVAIERGEWNNIQQDWLGILVTEGNTRLDTGMYTKEVLERVMEAATQAAITRAKLARDSGER